MTTETAWCWTCGAVLLMETGSDPGQWLMHQQCPGCGDVGNLRREVLVGLRADPRLDAFLEMFRGLPVHFNCRSAPEACRGAGKRPENVEPGGDIA